MKKFNIKEWSKKQKTLLKEQDPGVGQEFGTIQPETPLGIGSWNCVGGTCTDPGDGSGTYSDYNHCVNNCLSQSPAGAVVVGNTQHWNDQGFPPYSATARGGWLYYCNNGGYQEFLLASDAATTSDVGGFAIQTAVLADASNISPTTYWSGAGWQSVGDVTPADVISYCINNPAAMLGGYIKCTKILFF